MKKVKKMAFGGMAGKPMGPPPMGPSTGVPLPMAGKPMPRMKKGGKVFRHHDGIAQRGKTRA